MLWQRELSRAVDYAETRSDLDTSRAAFFGLSAGAILGPVFTALEPRFKASVLLSGGVYTGMPNEFDVVSFIPRVKVPTLVLHGRYDAIRAADPHARVVFELLRLPASQKRLALADAGHSLPMNFVMAEALAFLDKHLEPVQAASGADPRTEPATARPGQAPAAIRR